MHESRYTAAFRSSRNRIFFRDVNKIVLSEFLEIYGLSMSRKMMAPIKADSFHGLGLFKRENKLHFILP